MFWWIWAVVSGLIAWGTIPRTRLVYFGPVGLWGGLLSGGIQALAIWVLQLWRFVGGISLAGLPLGFFMSLLPLAALFTWVLSQNPDRVAAVVFLFGVGQSLVYHFLAYWGLLVYIRGGLLWSLSVNTLQYGVLAFLLLHPFLQEGTASRE